MKKGRKGNWDFAKTILMGLIIFGHVCPAPAESWNMVTRIIGLFAIPLFFFISGYFQSIVTDRKDYLNKLGRTFKRIVVPLLSWGFIYVSLMVARNYPVSRIENGIPLHEYIKEVLLFLKYTPFYITGIFWFLTALVICIFIGSFFSIVLHNRKIIGSLIIACSPFVFCLMPFDKYHFTFIWFFYAMGMLYRKWEKTLPHVNDSPKQIFLFIILSFFVFYSNYYYYPANTFYGRSNLLRDSSICFLLLRFVTYFLASLTALYWIMFIYKKYSKTYLICMLSSWGQDTLFAYCSHVLILIFFYFPFKHYLIPENDSISIVTFVCIISFLLTIILYVIIQKACSSLKQFRSIRLLLMGM